MQNEKCFCHFNGYEVKDAKARRDIESLNQEIDTLSNEVTTTKSNVASMNSDVTKSKTDIEVMKNSINVANENIVTNTNSIQTNSKSINAVDTKVGVIENLTTTDKSNVVNAVNELKDAVDNADTTLLSDEVNTIKTNIGSLENLETIDKTSLVNAINEAKQDDSGWIDLETLKGTWNYAKARKIGKQVYIKCYATDFVLTTGVEDIINLPDEFVPNDDLLIYGHCSGGNIARLVTTKENKKINIHWIRNLGGNDVILNVNTWLSFTFNYCVDEGSGE